MATGSALFPSASTFPGTGVYPGQGTVAYMVARLSFEGAQSPDPLEWVDVSDRLRAFSIERGGEQELDNIDTGTASVVLSNSDDELDPFNTGSTYAPNVKPRRRLWLQAQFDGQTEDVFYGWTGAFKPEWPGLGYDQVVTLAAQDGFAILAGDALPTTSPPRDSYADVLQHDEPYMLVPFNEPSEVFEVVDISEHNRNPLYAPTLAPTFGLAGGVVGQRDTAAGEDSAASILWATEAETIADVPGYFGGHNQLTFGWLFYRGGSASGMGFAGPTLQTGSAQQWVMFENADGTHKFKWRLRIGGAYQDLESTTVTSVGNWYHVYGTWDGTTQRIYVNGVQENTSAESGTFQTDTVIDTGMGPSFNTNMRLAYCVIYDYALPAARVAAHYEAAREMGLEQATTADHHIAMLLDEGGLSFVPRRLRTGQREIAAVYFTGQSPRGPLEDTCKAEGDPAMCFFAGDGAAVFLDQDHRTVSPWNTVQATFDDDGTDIPYHAIEIDDGESFIYNDVRVTAAGGTLQQSTDTTSIAAYQRRVLDRGETLNVDDTDADAEADALLAKYKDPLPRITALTLHGSNASALSQMIGRELGDQVRVFRRPTGGGSAIDQSSHIRKIKLSGDASTDRHWTCEWSLSKR